MKKFRIRLIPNTNMVRISQGFKRFQVGVSYGVIHALENVLYVDIFDKPLVPCGTLSLNDISTNSRGAGYNFYRDDISGKEILICQEWLIKMGFEYDTPEIYYQAVARVK